MVDGLNMPPDLDDLHTPANGLVGFGGSLRLFGREGGDLPSLADWNDEHGWRAEYKSLAAGLTFIAEDAFGNQFAWDGIAVLSFTAETANRMPIAKTAREWSEIVRDDQDRWLDRWLVEQWTAMNGPLAPSHHLVPRFPFSFGCAREVGQLVAVERHKDMLFKGSVAWQTKDVPPGGKVRFDFTD